MATATAMYHSKRNPLKRITPESEQVDVVKGEKRRRLHKAFLRYHDPNNWPLLREALKSMGRADLIGNGKHHLIPTFQPMTDGAYTSARKKNSTQAPGSTLSKQPQVALKSNLKRQAQPKSPSQSVASGSLEFSKKVEKGQLLTQHTGLPPRAIGARQGLKKTSSLSTSARATVKGSKSFK
jgi:hypothetical protein